MGLLGTLLEHLWKSGSNGGIIILTASCRFGGDTQVSGNPDRCHTSQPLLTSSAYFAPEYWMETYDDFNRLVVAYEDLTDDYLGADIAIKIAEFLNRSEGVTSRPIKEVPCIWHTIVKYKDLKPQVKQNGNQIVDQESKRGGPKYIAPYSEAQLKDMLNVLTKLLEKYRNNEAINYSLVRYIDEVAKRAGGPPEDLNTVVE